MIQFFFCQLMRQQPENNEAKMRNFICFDFLSPQSYYLTIPPIFLLIYSYIMRKCFFFGVVCMTKNEDQEILVKERFLSTSICHMPPYAVK
jgi:hypothetical protein